MRSDPFDLDAFNRQMEQVYTAFGRVWVAWKDLNHVALEMRTADEVPPKRGEPVGAKNADEFAEALRDKLDKKVGRIEEYDQMMRNVAKSTRAKAAATFCRDIADAFDEIASRYEILEDRERKS